MDMAATSPAHEYQLSLSLCTCMQQQQRQLSVCARKQSFMPDHAVLPYQLLAHLLRRHLPKCLGRHQHCRVDIRGALHMLVLKMTAAQVAQARTTRWQRC